MSEDLPRERWLRIYEPVEGATSGLQESAIRAFAEEEGFKDLRGFHMRLRSMGWDYYDVLKVTSP